GACTDRNSWKAVGHVEKRIGRLIARHRRDLLDVVRIDSNDARTPAYPEISRQILDDCRDVRFGKSVLRSQRHESSVTEPIEALARSDPHPASRVLVNGTHRAASQTVLLRIRRGVAI